MAIDRNRDTGIVIANVSFSDPFDLEDIEIATGRPLRAVSCQLEIDNRSPTISYCAIVSLRAMTFDIASRTLHLKLCDLPRQASHSHVHRVKRPRIRCLKPG